MQLWTQMTRRVGWITGAAAAALALVLALPASAQNVIQRENAKTTGVTTAWQISDASYASAQQIEGYASATSVNRGQSINLYVNTSDPTYTINVYRIGWYGGSGGRLVHGPVTRNRATQPACPMIDTATRLVECNWTDPYVLTVPSTADATDWASGIYLAKLTGSGGKQSYIIFVVRDDARAAAAMFQSSVTTYQAYNNWGGYDFYDTDSVGLNPAKKVSFNRPYRNSQRPSHGKGAGDFLSWEVNMLRFVEREGYDVKYSTNIDTHTAPARLLAQPLFMSVGHDEYYTPQMFDAVQAARDAGVNLAFFGANAIYWPVRFESSSTGQANRTLVAYKLANDPIAATNPGQSTTGLWRDPPHDRPEAALMGVMYDYNSLDSDIVISDCSSWVCAGTGLLPGAVLPGMLGYEVDRVDASSPAGVTVIASSPYVVNGEVRYSNVTFYVAGSGAGVFATGSMQWNWGLDAFTSSSSEHGDRTNEAVQQMTRNVLDRLIGGLDSLPLITTAPPTTATVGVTYRYDVDGTYAGGGLTYSLAEHPAGMTINPGTGLVTWTPSAAQAGTQPVTVVASAGDGTSTTQTFAIEASVPNAPPQITTAPVTAAQAGVHYSYDVGATDSNGDTLTYTLAQAPAGMTINAGNGLIGWTPSAGQVGSQAVTVRVVDPGGLAATQSFNIAVAAANVAPQVVSTPVTRATEGAAYLYDVDATDANGDALTYTLTQAPAGMTINAGTGLIGWTPTTAQVGNQAVTVRVADPAGLVATQGFTVRVDAANVAPRITTQPVTTATTGNAYAYAVGATDGNGDPLTFSLTQAPAGMTIGAASGAIAWTPTAAQAGSQAVTVRAADLAGLVATQSFTIVVSVANVAPVIVPASASATVGEAFRFQVVATDANGDALTYALTLAPPGMAIDTRTGLVSWVPGAAQLGDQTFVVRVSDPGGLTATLPFAVVVGSVPVAPAPDFTVATSETGASLVAGETASTRLTITASGGFTGPVSFSCSGLPSAASCTFAPSSVDVVSGTAAVTTVTFSTTARASAAAGTLLLASLPAGLLLLGSSRPAAGRRRLPVAWAGTAAVALTMLALHGCGGGGDAGTPAPAPPGPTPAGTPAGAYPVQITATDGKVSRTVTFELTVR